MGNTLIKVSCDDQTLNVIQNPLVASGGVNEDAVEFSFDSLWEGYAKTAVFYRDENTVYNVVLDSNNKAIVPQEVLQDEGTLFFGVFGVSGNITRTSEILAYKIKQGAITTGTTPPAPTQSVYEQILAAMANKANVNQGVENAGKYWKVAEDGSLTFGEVTGGGGSYTLPIASASTLGGVKINPARGLNVNADGTLRGESRTNSQYDSDMDTAVICKGTLENVKNKIVKDGMTNSSDAWTNAEQDAAIAKIGLHSTYMLNKYANNYSRLPKLKLTGDVSGMSKANAKTLSFEYFAANATAVNYSGYAKVKWQGSSSLAYEKKNYTITLFSDSACTTAQNIEFVTGWGAHNKYCMKANFIDHTHARNIVTAKLWGECVKSRTNTEQSYIKLNGLVNGGAIDGYPIMLFINGTYAGLYTFNIPKEDWLFGMTGLNTECVLSGEKWDEVTQFYTTPTAANIGGNNPSWDYEIEPADNSWVLSSLQAVYTALQMPMDTSEQTEAKITAMEACMDIESVIDYCVMCDILGVTDNLGKNMLLATFDGTKWMMSAYDLDTAFGNYWDGTKFIAPTDDAAGTDFTNNNLTFTVWKLYGAKFNARRRYILENIFRVDRIMDKVYSFHSFITSELMNGETMLYPSMPNANENGLQQIESYLAKRIDYKTNTFNMVYDQTLTAVSSYVWIGNVGAQKLRIRLDYPTDGIGTAQNVILNINDVPCAWLWHETTATIAFFDVELCDGVIFTKATSGSPNFPTSAVPATLNTLSWLALDATSIPSGTRIRVYALG